MQVQKFLRIFYRSSRLSSFYVFSQLNKYEINKHKKCMNCVTQITQIRSRKNDFATTIISQHILDMALYIFMPRVMQIESKTHFATLKLWNCEQFSKEITKVWSVVSGRQLWSLIHRVLRRTFKAFTWIPPRKFNPLMKHLKVLCFDKSEHASFSRLNEKVVNPIWFLNTLAYWEVYRKNRSEAAWKQWKLKSPQTLCRDGSVLY